MNSFKLSHDSAPELIEERYNLRDRDYFISLLSYSGVTEPDATARRLLQRYRTIENAVTADVGELSEFVGERAAVFLKLCGYLTSRRETDRLSYGCCYSPSEIAEYLKALFIGESVEKVYLLSFDSEDRLLACDFISVGTVGASDVLPRKLMERALCVGARSVSLAHNHPFGDVEMSADDAALTAKLESAFAEIGVRLSAHYIVAGQSVSYVRQGLDEPVSERK